MQDASHPNPPSPDAPGRGEPAPPSPPAESPPAESPPPAPRKGPRRRVRWIIRGIFLAIIGSAFFVGCDSFFYYPSDRVWQTPPQLGLRHEDVQFQTADGLTLHGWFLPAERQPARGSVLHFHGNAENITAHLVLVEWLPRRGYNVLMFDYRGYGQSEGRVTREGTIRDGHAALDYLLSRPDIDPNRIVAYGQSLGGAVATVVTAERPEIRGLVLESTFSSYRGIAALHIPIGQLLPGPARWLAAALISSGWDPIDYIARVSPRPVLVIGAERDGICFPQLSRELFDAAGEPRRFWLVPDAAHLDVLSEAGTELERRVVELFEQALRRR